MDLLGVGVPELLFIFIIALMVLGPRRLPEYAAKAGKTLRDLRNMSRGFIIEWQRELAVASRLDELQELRHELQETRKMLSDTSSELQADASAATKDVAKAVDDASQAAAETPTIAPPRASSEPNVEQQPAAEPAVEATVSADPEESTPTKQTQSSSDEGQQPVVNGTDVSVSEPEPVAIKSSIPTTNGPAPERTQKLGSQDLNNE